MSVEATETHDAEYWAPLVPELLVTNLEASLTFYRDCCGFQVRFARPEDRFAYLELGGAQLMLEEATEDSWITGRLEPPYGRGINFQIEVPDVASLHEQIRQAGARLFLPLRTEWYREGATEHGQAQFLVQDPDGYLLRFIQHIGERLIEPGF